MILRTLSSVALLLLLASSLSAQRPERRPAAAAWAPDTTLAILRRHAPHESGALAGSVAELGRSDGERRRSKWTYPLIGAGLGAVGGYFLGNYALNSADDWVAPPPHYVTIPLGAAAGALLGIIVDALVPR